MAGIRKRLGSILGPEGRVPQFVEGTTTQLDSSEPARVGLTKTGNAEYRLDFQVPRGLDGDPTAVADFSQAMAAEINTETSAGRAAVDSAIDDRAGDIASLATPQMDYVSTLSTMAGYNTMTVTKTSESGALDVTCTTPGGGLVTYSLNGASRYQYVGQVKVTDPSAGERFTDKYTIPAMDLNTTNFEWSGTTTSPWTNQVGAVWTQEVTVEHANAPVIYRHYTEDRGGIWRISVDDTNLTTDISTWNPTTTTRQQPLFSLPTPGTFTIRGEFLGDDPDNPPRGGAGTARGWAGPVNLSRTETLIVQDKAPLEVVVSPTSNKDFALRIKKAGAAGNTEFVPYHGTESEAFASPTRYYNAGTPIDIDEMTVGEPVAVDSFEWVQHLYGRNSNTGDENLIEIWTTQKIDSYGVFSVTGRWKTLSDIETGSYLYHLMLMGSLPLFDEAVSSISGTYELDPSQAPASIWTSEGNRADGWALLSSTTDIVAAVRHDNRSETSRAGQEHTQATNRQTYIELRSGGNMAKVYPIHYATGTTIPAGRTHRFSGAYFYGVAPGAKGALSLA